MFHKVLVATGGSPWSEKAVQYAIGLAKDYDLRLVILHVITDTPPYFIAEAGASSRVKPNLPGDGCPRWYAVLHKSAIAI
jgi:nucleotide-binding universal stress UspA family protein